MGIVNRPTLLCVHQGNELYGSDRVFAESVRSLRQSYPDARIDVVLPGTGPLEQLLLDSADNVLYGPLWVLRKSHFNTVRGMCRAATLFGAVWQARKLMRDYDLVYINTIVVINFLLAALLDRFLGGPPALVHVHELIPGFTRKIFGRLVRLSSSAVVCNSKATALSFELAGLPDVHTVWNGTNIPASSTPPSPAAGHPLKVLMPGRINSWKGQDLLVDAIALIKPQCRNFSVRIVGDVYKGQDHFKDKLHASIHTHGLDDIVDLAGFHENMDEMYKWADIVVIPSTSPEPFGVVAVEAMSHARPVIAANHGGLKEIVQDNATGWLFPPGDAAALANLLDRLTRERSEISTAGKQARKCAEQEFANERYRMRIAAIVSDLLFNSGTDKGT